MSETRNGFSEYKKLFLNELERLDKSYNQINTSLAEIKETIVDINSTIKNITKSNDDHENRIRSLEVDRWKLIGALIFANVLIGIVVKFI